MSFGTILNSWFLIWKRNKNLVPNPSLKSIHVVNTYYIPELMWRDTFIFIHSTNIYWESIMCQTLKWTPKKKKMIAGKCDKAEKRDNVKVWCEQIQESTWLMWSGETNRGQLLELSFEWGRETFHTGNWSGFPSESAMEKDPGFSPRIFGFLI